MHRYWIPGHVFVCILRDIVWFDEKNNKYLTVDGAAGQILALAVHGWPAFESTGPVLQITDQQRESLISGLVSKGLLSEQLGEGKRYASRLDDRSKGGADFDGRIPNAPIRWHHVAQVAIAYLWAVVAFRICRLRFAIASVERRKRRCAVRTSIDRDEVRELVSAFQRLRLFFYSPKDQCVLDTLVLMFYLSGYGIGATVVFGVAVRPFVAHCWGEWDGHVLNGGSEIAGRHHRIRQV